MHVQVRDRLASGDADVDSNVESQRGVQFENLLARYLNAIQQSEMFLARRITDASAELLQTVVHRRYKLRRSIVVTSNRVVQDWGKYLGDNTMSTTILDRLMHRATLLEFEGNSYRLKEAAARIARAA